MVHRVAIVAISLLISSGAAADHLGERRSLADPSPTMQVTDIRYCRGEYHVTTAANLTVVLSEFNLMFKTDGGPDGPRPGQPVIVPTGSRGDRGVIVFSRPGEISRSVRLAC